MHTRHAVYRGSDVRFGAFCCIVGHKPFVASLGLTSVRSVARRIVRMVVHSKRKAPMRCPILMVAALGTVVGQPAPAFSQNADTPNSSQTAQMPGRLIDVGGWRLHLNCVGDRRP